MFSDPKRRMSFSVAVLVVGGIFGAVNSKGVHADPLITILAWAYIFWALFWGMPPFLSWWQSSGKKMLVMLNLLPFGCFAMMVTSVLVPLLAGPFYSLYGGGIYHFVKNLMIVRRLR